MEQSTESWLTAGVIYRFRVSALNVIGEGPASNYVTVAAAAPASQPPPPTIDRSLSTIDSLFVEWDEGDEGDIAVTGFRLYMTEKGTGNAAVVYDGSSNSRTKRFWVQGLATGQYYAFYVVALDFNSESPPSEETVAAVCVSPGHLESP